jgi:flagellar motility protein MotE (MotC chaperone)
MSWFRIERAFWSIAFASILGITVLTSIAGNEETAGAAQTEQTQPEPSASVSPLPSSLPSDDHQKKEGHSGHHSSHGKKAEACLTSEAVIEDIKLAQEENEAKKKELEVKEAELLAREKALENEIKKLEELRNTISKTQESKVKANNEKIAKLVEMILGMSPKAASKLLSTVDDDLAVAAMSQMDTQRLAKIVNMMDPAKSSKLSEMMTGVSRKSRAVSNDTVSVNKQIEKGGEKNGKFEQRTSGELQQPVGKRPNAGIAKVEKTQ